MIDKSRFATPREFFPRDENGLVDLSCYLRYLPDPPDRVPVLESADGINVALEPERLYDLSLGPPQNGRHLSPSERAELFDHQRSLALDALADPLVTPQRVVTSALKRLAVFLNDQKLNRLASLHLAED